MIAAGGDRSGPVPAGRARWILALLAALFVISFVDRLALGVLVDGIRADLHISDTQVGLLMGFSFVTFYSVAAIFLARVADVGDRRLLIVAGVLIWGAATTASAFAHSFAALFVLRIGVGIGEAALTPAALSTISDVFPADRRARAASLYLAAGMIGATGAPMLGGLAIHYAAPIAAAARAVTGPLAPWQAVFLAVGSPAILLGLIYAATVREPRRLHAAGESERASLADLRAHLRRQARPYAGLFGALGIVQVCAYAVIAWFPALLVRQFGFTPAEAGFAFGLAGLVGGPAGAIASPWLAQRRGGDARALLEAGLVFIIAAAPFVLLLPVAGNAAIALVLAAFALFCLIGTGAVAPVAAQLLAPNRMRGQVTAIYTCLTSLVGLGCGPLAVAWLNEGLGLGAQGLSVAMALVFAAIAPPCALVMLWSLGGTASPRPVSAVQGG